MGRGGPELPESIEKARAVLSDQEFYVPRSDLPEELDERKAYVSRLHVVLARTARRFEHSKRVVEGEQPPGDGPELPQNQTEAEAELDGRSFFVPVAELPDDPDRIGEYVERLHLQLARAAQAFRYNQQIIRQRQATEGADRSSATAATLDRSSDGDDASAGEASDESSTDAAERDVEEDATGQSATDDSDGADTDVETTADSGHTTGDDHSETDPVGDESDERPTDTSHSDESADGDDETTRSASADTPDPAGESDGDDNQTANRDDEQENGGFVFVDADSPDTERITTGDAEESDDDETVDTESTEEERPRRADTESTEEGRPRRADTESTEEERPRRADTESTEEGRPRRADTESTEEGRPRRADTETTGERNSRGADTSEESGATAGLTRRQMLFGGSAVALLTAVVGGGVAVLSLTDEDDGSGDGTDNGNPESTGGDDTTSGNGDDTSDGNGGNTGDDGMTDDDGGGETPPDDGSGGDDGNDDTGQSQAFELADYRADTTPNQEYVELAYTGEGERDISGHLLYDGEDGQAHPTEQGSLDPFEFPEGTVLAPGESVRVYTGGGDDGDGVFYWGYQVNIWNRDGDTVVLEDTSGSVVFEEEYGSQD